MKRVVKEALRRLTYRLGYQNLDHLSLLLESRLQKTECFFLIQIGANDGTMFDPIHDFVVRHRTKIEGLLLEPLSDLHAELEKTYRDYPSIRTLKLAVHNTEPSMTLYRVDPARLGDLPRFAQGIASFDAAHHLKSQIPDDAIVAETVSCISTTELIARYGVKKIDLLCIDTEGYDSEILRAFDFGTIKPAIIVFEHGLRHGIMTAESFHEVVMLLNRHGYDLMIHDYDVIAHLRGRLGIE